MTKDYEQLTRFRGWNFGSLYAPHDSPLQLTLQDGKGGFHYYHIRKNKYENKYEKCKVRLRPKGLRLLAIINMCVCVSSVTMKWVIVY